MPAMIQVYADENVAPAHGSTTTLNKPVLRSSNHVPTDGKPASAAARAGRAALSTVNTNSNLPTAPTGLRKPTAVTQIVQQALNNTNTRNNAASAMTRPTATVTTTVRPHSRAGSTSANASSDALNQSTLSAFVNQHQHSTTTRQHVPSTTNVDDMLVSPAPHHVQKPLPQQSVFSFQQPSQPMQIEAPISIPAAEVGQLTRDHLYSQEYASEIVSHMYGTETRYAADPTYMTTIQSDINGKMREILVDWLHEVHYRFKLLPETMFLTINYVDRFLSVSQINRNRLQLVGCAAMLLASKYEEIYCPEINDFVVISDSAYSRQEMISMEGEMLRTLEFNMTVPSSWRFAERYMLQTGLAEESQGYYHVMYLLQMGLQNFDFTINYKPSVQAAAATWLALKAVGSRRHTDLQLKTILHVEDITHFNACVTALSALQTSVGAGRYQAVIRKFNKPKYQNATSLNAATTTQ